MKAVFISDHHKEMGGGRQYMKTDKTGQTGREEQQTNIHEGHRQRIKEEVRQQGIAAMPPHKVLEALLYYAKPRGDVNALAHALIDRFGSFAGVLDATEEELLQVEEAGPGTALFLKLLPQVAAYYLKSKNETNKVVATSGEAAALFLPYFLDKKDEAVCLASFDGQGKLLRLRQVAAGSPAQSEVQLRQLVTEALLAGAVSAMVAHNHPTGVLRPSPQDIAFTAHLKETLSAVGVRLADHLILQNEAHFSMAHEGLL